MTFMHKYKKYKKVLHKYDFIVYNYTVVKEMIYTE